MAKSTYIYVVKHDAGTIYGTFTVKHEMISFLNKFSKKALFWMQVLRYKDGKPDDPVTSMNIEELLKE